MRVVLLVLLGFEILFGAKLMVKKWPKGESFAQYLEKEGIDFSFDTEVEKEDEQFLSEIEAGQEFYMLKDRQGVVEQMLIPLGEEMQIRLAKERKSGIYLFDIIPITYKEKEYSETVEILSNPHTDIKNSLNHPMLADKMSQLLGGAVDTTKLNKGDKLSFIYHQKTRMGLPHYHPEIKIAMLESKGKEQFIYADEEGYGYTSAKSLQEYTVKDRKKVTYTRRVEVGRGGSTFGMPLRNVRITSHFSKRRYHPILKRYRPHHGTDFGARKGTPLLAINSGKVIFSGYMRGYGKVVKIKHAGGYVSLYAHQSRIRVKRGAYVKKGQVIGHVGSTGRSSGPHLHLGITKNGRWINPMRILKKRGSKTILKKFTKYEQSSQTKYRTVEIKDAKKYRLKLFSHLKKSKKPFIWDLDQPKSVKVDL
jgi:murein DD-endopeptidase MepM/ murein hydrolase activator NlpD